MTRILAILLIIPFVFTACGKKNEEPTPEPQPVSFGQPPAPTPVFETAPDPNAPAFDIDGTIITRGDISKALQREIAAIKSSGMRELPMNQLQQGVVSAMVSQTLLLNEAKKSKITVTDEDIKAEFVKNADRLPPGLTFEVAMNNPELRNEIHRTMSIDKLITQRITNSLEATEQEIDDFYEERKEVLSQIPETVHARHILAMVDNPTNTVANEVKLKMLEDIRKKLIDGADFAELAKAHSDCPSKQAGGDLGTFKRGTMVAEFNDAAFSQKTNEIGEIVKTEHGYHIIQVLEHNKAGAFARDKAAAILKREKWTKAVQGMVTELHATAKIKQF